MKTNTPAPFVLLAMAAFALGGCSKERPANSTVAQTTATPGQTAPAIVQVTPVATDPFAEMKSALEKSTLDQHDGLAGIQQRMDQEIDALVASRKAAGADVSVTADGKLDSATMDFAEKLRMLSLARPETWNSAKHDAELALQGVRDAYNQVVNSPQRK